MREDLRIAWICNSSITTSETFLVDNHELLAELGSVSAHCGETPSVESKLAPFHYHQWHNVRQTLMRTMLSRALGKNRVTQIRQRRCTKALLQTLQDFDPHVIWIEFGTTAEVTKPLLSQLDKPYFINVHGFDVSRRFQDNEYRTSFFCLANKAEKVIVASQYIANKLIAQGLSADRISIVPLAVSVQDNLHAKKTKHPSFVHFGRLTEVKGVHVLLRAFQKVQVALPSARLTIIGEGEQGEELKHLCQQLDLDPKVSFLGSKERQEAHSILAQHWVMCQANVTSRFAEQEAFGLSLAEAAALELPVIGTNYGGIPEHVLNGQTGVLVPEMDIYALAHAMIKLANDPEIRASMGRRGKENIRFKFQRNQRRDAIQTLFEAVR